MTAKPLLEIKKLQVSFSNNADSTKDVIRAVRDISLELPEASFVSLVGESGSGKSVTALSITRLLGAQITSGEINWHFKGGNKMDLLSVTDEIILNIRGKEIAYVFQDPNTSLNPVIRAGEQVAEACLIHCRMNQEEAREKALSLFLAVKLNDAERVYKSFPHELSGGMKQRVMIAMALASNPRLLIADEPTTALDIVTEREIMQLISSIQKERGLSVLFITHNLALASEYSDQMYVLEKGLVAERLLRVGGVFEPKQPFTKKLFTARLHNAEPKSIIHVA